MDGSTHPQKTAPMTDRTYDIEPFVYVKMTARGKWNKREQLYLRNKGYLQMLGLDYQEGWGVTFVLTMPKSWSKKKREAMNGEGVRRPKWKDIDNLLKSFFDGLSYDDGTIAETGPMRKIWGERGKIIVHQRVADYF
ncbi:MAG: hypothetical protein COB09_16910 [Thalassobium sp.]|nr:MAG: hypothetical protein COB09_16910 [Thalassobium sp.]